MWLEERVLWGWEREEPCSSTSMGQLCCVYGSHGSVWQTPWLVNRSHYSLFFSLSLFLLPFSSSSSSSCHLYLYLFVGKGTPHEYIYTRPKQRTHAHTHRRSETHATTPSSTALRVRLWGMKVRQRDTIICDGFRQ